MIVGSDDGSVFSGLDDGIGVCRANRHAESVRDQFRVDAYASQRVDYCGDRDFLRYRAVAGVLSGLAAGCHVIAVNAPADTPRLNEVDLVLHSLEQITVTKQPNGDVIIQ